MSGEKTYTYRPPKRSSQIARERARRKAQEAREAKERAAERQRQALRDVHHRTLRKAQSRGTKMLNQSGVSDLMSVEEQGQFEQTSQTLSALQMQQDLKAAERASAHSAELLRNMERSLQPAHQRKVLLNEIDRFITEVQSVPHADKLSRHIGRAVKKALELRKTILEWKGSETTLQDISKRVESLQVEKKFIRNFGYQYANVEECVQQLLADGGISSQYQADIISRLDQIAATRPEEIPTLIDEISAQAEQHQQEAIKQVILAKAVSERETNKVILDIKKFVRKVNSAENISYAGKEVMDVQSIAKEAWDLAIEGQFKAATETFKKAKSAAALIPDKVTKAIEEETEGLAQLSQAQSSLLIEIGNLHLKLNDISAAMSPTEFGVLFGLLKEAEKNAQSLPNVLPDESSVAIEELTATLDTVDARMIALESLRAHAEVLLEAEMRDLVRWTPESREALQNLTPGTPLTAVLSTGEHLEVELSIDDNSVVRFTKTDFEEDEGCDTHKLLTAYIAHSLNVDYEYEGDYGAIDLTNEFELIAELEHRDSEASAKSEGTMAKEL